MQQRYSASCHTPLAHSRLLTPLSSSLLLPCLCPRSSGAWPSSHLRRHHAQRAPPYLAPSRRPFFFSLPFCTASFIPVPLPTSCRPPFPLPPPSLFPSAPLPPPACPVPPKTPPIPPRFSLCFPRYPWLLPISLRVAVCPRLDSNLPALVRAALQSSHSTSARWLFASDS